MEDNDNKFQYLRQETKTTITIQASRGALFSIVSFVLYLIGLAVLLYVNKVFYGGGVAFGIATFVVETVVALVIFGNQSRRFDSVDDAIEYLQKQKGE